MVTKEKNRVWKEFWRVMEKGFWQTVRRLKNGKQVWSSADPDWEFFEQWKMHFEKLLNPANTSIVEETEFKDLGKPQPSC